MIGKTTLKVSLLIPTYNAGHLWIDVLNSITFQSFKFHQKIIVDSGSKDDTVKLAIEHGFEVFTIPQFEFNHGATRQLLVDYATGADICVFITQDAILADDKSINKIVKAFDDLNIGLAYGRQLPRKNAGALETHARIFNYPEKSKVKSYKEKDILGFKVFFCSNSFAAYRVNALKEVGGFPRDSIMGEDALVAAKLLMNGYLISYIASTAVYHSHNYLLKEEFRRYFDTRVFHEQNKWLIEHYGKPTGEGLKYMKSELKFLLSNDPKSIFKFWGSLFAKWLGYKSGKYYKKIPYKILKRLSMHKSYWISKAIN